VGGKVLLPFLKELERKFPVQAQVVADTRAHCDGYQGASAKIRLVDKDKTP
jgi:hypothetical protein